jgi:hypothetical protein
MRDLNEEIADKIAGHKKADAAAGRDFDEKEYITVKRVKDTLMDQKYRCAERECQTKVETQWKTRTRRTSRSVVDRRNNTLPQTPARTAGSRASRST